MFSLVSEEPHSSIVCPVIVADNFELKPSMIFMVQRNQFFYFLFLFYVCFIFVGK